jgi:flagellar biosynthesis protein FlhG
MMSFEKRIIPVSSGKGGVGKTTIALNYALSLARYGKTVLIDLDTGTSSLRTCIDTTVERDLYHFFKKGATLADCVTPLDTASIPPASIAISASSPRPGT